MNRIQKAFDDNYVYITFFISFLAVFGSLYYSEVLRIPPCYLCWYQRILMYPLLFLSTISLLTKERLPKKFILVLTLPGMFLAFYHYLVQKFEIGKEFLNCSPSTPCDRIDVQYLGFITIPFLSFLAFFVINFAILVTYRRVKKLK